MEQEKIEIILNNIEKDFKIKKYVLIRPKTLEEAYALYDEINGLNYEKDYYTFEDYCDENTIITTNLSKEIYKRVWFFYYKDYIRYCQKHGYQFENYGCNFQYIIDYDNSDSCGNTYNMYYINDYKIIEIEEILKESKNGKGAYCRIEDDSKVYVLYNNMYPSRTLAKKAIKINSSKKRLAFETY
ncbi:hypothetical protein G8V05_05305 [Clostridium botulinum C/D]|uniref:hypothetical protein n=1 Tax=Clostridium botulinum TaxID=1491 RepID=UPI001E5F569C|nr:hypothetical protein [Clostridium botulinum]MCD3281634.1 hypothetical protein [Clostridium botulinum C/D]